MNSCHSRKGVAILAALLALVAVALAITAVTGHVSDEARRSMDQTAAAQIEQMLMAGAIDAQFHLNAGAVTTGQEWETELPAQLTEQGASLRTSILTADENGPISLRITARMQRRAASQIVRFNRGENAWKISSAEFEG